MAKKIFILAAVLFVLGAILLTVGMVMPITTEGLFGASTTTSIANDMKTVNQNLFEYHDALVQLKSLGLWTDSSQPFLTNANIAISGFSFIIISIAAGIAGFVMKSMNKED